MSLPPVGSPYRLTLNAVARTQQPFAVVPGQRDMAPFASHCPHYRERTLSPSERRRLGRREPVDRRCWVSTAEGPDEVRNVGAADLAELDQDLMRRHHVRRLVPQAYQHCPATALTAWRCGTQLKQSYSVGSHSFPGDE